MVWDKAEKPRNGKFCLIQESSGHSNHNPLQDRVRHDRILHNTCNAAAATMFELTVAKTSPTTVLIDEIVTTWAKGCK
jgi:hypothetical protein